MLRTLQTPAGQAVRDYPEAMALALAHVCTDLDGNPYPDGTAAHLAYATVHALTRGLITHTWRPPHAG